MYLVGRVPAALDGAVLGLAGYDEMSPIPLRRRELPTGSCTLILGFGASMRVPGGVGPAFLAGMQDTAVLTEFVGRQRGVQVDLSPLATRRLLARPTGELTGRVVALDELGAPELAALPARLAEHVTWAARFADVTTTLSRALTGTALAADPEVEWAWRELRRTGGRVPVGRLAEETGWSRRHLLDRFRDQVGLTPTAARRVLRLRWAAQTLMPGRGPVRTPGDGRIADVAAACGFADHAHLVREFHAIAGCTPSAFVGQWQFPDVQDPVPPAP